MTGHRQVSVLKAEHFAWQVLSGVNAGVDAAVLLGLGVRTHQHVGTTSYILPRAARVRVTLGVRRETAIQEYRLTI